MKSKIYLIFASIALFFIVFSLLALNRVYTINHQSTEIETHWIPSIVAINVINTLTRYYRVDETLHVLKTTEPDERESLANEMQWIISEVTNWRNKYELLIFSAEERSIYQQFSKNYNDYLAASQQVLTLSKNKENEQATLQLKKTGELFNAFGIDLVKLLEINRSGEIETRQKGNVIYQQSKTTIIISSGFMAILSLIFMLLLEASSKSPTINLTTKLSPKIKIRFYFTYIIIILGIYSWLILNRIELVNQQSIDMKVNWLPSIIAIDAINTATSNYRIAEVLHILTTDSNEMAKIEQDMEHLVGEITHWRSQYETLISSEKERGIYQEFSQQYDEYKKGSGQVITFSRNNNKEEAAIQLKENGILFGVFSRNLHNLVELNEISGIVASHTSDNIYRLVKIFLIGSTLVIITVLTILALLLERWLSFQEPILIVTIKPTRKIGFFNSLTIKAKLRLAFLGIVSFFILFNLLVEILIKKIDDTFTEIEKDWLPSILIVNAINAATSNYRIAETFRVLTTEKMKVMHWQQELERLTKEIAKLRTLYEALISSEEEKSIYQSFSVKFEEYLTASKQTVLLARQNENKKAAEQLKRNGILFEGFSYDLVRLVKLNKQGGEKASLAGKQTFNESRQISVFAGLLVFMVVIIFLIVFEKNISYQLQQLAGLVQRLANGDVSVTSQFQDRYDEVGQMANAVNEIANTLRRLTSDSLELIEASQAGILSARIEVEHHPGEFGKIVLGMNQLLTVLSKPLMEVAHVMQDLASGELSERMPGHYEGEMRALQANVNRSLEALVRLLSELTAITQQMAQGNLTQRLTGNYQGEFSVLKANTNQAISQMKEILQTIAAHAESSATATMQTAKAAEHVANQAAQQMVALEEVAVAIEESVASVKDISNNATQGNELASTSAKLAAEGQEQLNRLTTLIQQIGNEYHRIEQITGEITRIADKTHLLSLNAGLEAMRAGEHGLGFGFVAQQIGKLAEEVSTSARNIGGVITNSVASVQLGVQAAEETRQVVAQIATTAKTSGEMVQNISVAIVQQSMAVQSLSERISEIQVSSESTATAAEEISQTMTQLAAAVQQTSVEIQRFTLD
ncbi:MAG: HAMP domain-containing protein [Thioploca sp.]|nr:HAMP domain-containing protein [Thioploca sp.]